MQDTSYDLKSGKINLHDVMWSIRWNQGMIRCEIRWNQCIRCEVRWDQCIWCNAKSSEINVYVVTWCLTLIPTLIHSFLSQQRMRIASPYKYMRCEFRWNQCIQCEVRWNQGTQSEVRCDNVILCEVRWNQGHHKTWEKKAIGDSIPHFMGMVSWNRAVHKIAI